MKICRRKVENRILVIFLFSGPKYNSMCNKKIIRILFLAQDADSGSKERAPQQQSAVSGDQQGKPLSTASREVCSVAARFFCLCFINIDFWIVFFVEI
jgi:hypothetical protein